MKTKTAFTLVEVLITILLLSLLMTTAMFSFRFLIKNLNTLQLSLPQKAMNYEHLDRSIQGLYFYIIEKKNHLKKEKTYFFNYGSSSFTYITTQPIYNKSISIATVEYKENALFYSESKLFTQNKNYLLPKNNVHDFQKKLYENINSLDIKYVFQEKTNIPKLIQISFLDKNHKKQTWIFSIFSDFREHILYTQPIEDLL